MEVHLVLKAAGFIYLDMVGIPGNLTVLLFFCYLRLSDGRLLPNDLILSKLAFVYLVVVLCRGIPQALTALGIQNLFGEYGCKVVIFTYRIGRAMSICITSLLSCYQCIVIAPGSTRWTVLKQSVPRNIPLIILLLYGLNFMILYYHRKQMRGMHGSDRNQRKTAEASKSLLMLVAMYVILFGLDNVMWVYTLCVTRVHPAVNDTRVFFASCYSALSPVFIIATNQKFAARLNCYSHGQEENIGTTVTTVSHIPAGL
ncbi:olfactory receptor class A-like protein 1 [Amia ocellicauda]|uniref:olfactory receptor class A-like protein 1 n=1 Tax=Amia ocellicauda TaxID=2972642 RepID=UPI003463A66B